MKRKILILFLCTVQFFNSIGFLILPAYGNVKEVQPPLDSKISDDKKTFFSGSLLQPGTYFAGLSVHDKTGQTDTAYTESVTVTYPHQMVIVFATTDPHDKKIYEASESLTPEGFPVMFKSKITGNYKSISYKWDFGDGACQQAINGAYSECFEPNPTHNYFDGKKSFGGIEFKDRKSITPKLTITAAFGDGRTETWDASAGTITFNTEPQFVLVDLKADNYSGIAPFTVNLMIDPATAKVVNATPVKYELDWGDGSEITLGVITFEELIAKSFTHTYTTSETYNPKLTVYIKETTKPFVFNVGDVTVTATGVGGISLLDDLNDISITNQPIVTFMVNTVFANPSDLKNRLRIYINDKENNESVTELVPNSNNQTISLSEGKNIYYFETSDSSNQTIMSETREITLDSTNPFVEITSPQEGELISKENKIYLSGIITDENTDSISYKINNQTTYTQISNSNIEDIGDGNNVNSKFFTIELDPIVVGNVDKISIQSKDKAGNESLEEISLGSDRSVKLLSQTNNVVEVKDDGIEYPIDPGERFGLLTNSFTICDDMSKPKEELHLPPYQLQANQSSEITINNTVMVNDIGNAGIYSSNPELVNIDGCITINDYRIHATSDFNYSNNQTFDPGISGSLSSIWKPGSYTITKKISETSDSFTTYGTTFGNNSLTYSSDFKVKILRSTNAFINAVSSNNLELNMSNNISFNVLFTDSIPFTSERAQNAQVTSDYLLTPSNMQDPINLSCSVVSDQTYPSNSLTKKCSFTYTPSEVTGINGSKYKLDFKILFPQEIGESERPTRYGKIEFSPSFIVPGNITTPSEYTVIQSSNQTVEGSIDKTSLTDIVGMIDDSTAISFAMFTLQFSQNGVTKDLVSASNQLIIRTNNGNSNLLTYGTNINFNLNKNSELSPYFKDLSIFGPVNLYTALTTASNNNYSSNQGRKLILLDKPKIQDAQITSNTKTLQKTLKLKISNNAPTMGDYALEIVLEPKDNEGNLINDDKYQNTIYVNIPNSSNTVTKNIKIPPYTKSVKVTLNRNTNFLNETEKRISSLSDWDVSKFSKGNYKKADEKEVTTAKNQVTDISLDKQSAELGETVTATYTVKTLKGSYLTLYGKHKVFNTEAPILQDSIADISTGLTGIKSYAVNQDWVDKYSEIRFQLSSAGEFDSTVLKLGGNEKFFNEQSKETDLITLPFVENGNAQITDFLIAKDENINLQFSENLSLSSFKELLKDLQLLRSDNNNGFDLETQEATYELFQILDYLRCNEQSILKTREDSKLQVLGSPIQCGISASNYLDYISTSYNNNLQAVVFLKSLSNTLKYLGANQPPVNNDLPDSLLMRALASEEALLPLPPWAKAAVWLGAYVISTALANQKMKVGYSEQIKSDTCTRTFGIIDRRFFIGKNLQNQDIKRTNTMVGITINGITTIKPEIVEPFPYIPNQFGTYYTCLPSGNQNITLQFNDQNTFSMSVTVSNKHFHFVEPFIGGVFRKYGKISAIESIIGSTRILDSGAGDIMTSLSPSGAGTYLTDLSLKPTYEATKVEIAKALRLYKSGTFELGNPSSVGELELDKAEAYIDLALDTRAYILESDQRFPLQYLIPSSFLDFKYPNEKSNSILIDKFGVE